MHRNLATMLALGLLSLPATTLAAPELFHRGSVALDTVALGGDNDRQLEPGESIDLVLTIGNEGDVAARNITATLTSTHPGLVVSAVPASVSFPDLPINTTAPDAGPHFRLTADPGIPCGEPVRLLLSLRYEDEVATPLQADIDLILFVGERTQLFYEDFDTGPGGWNQDPINSTALAGDWVNAAPQAYLWMGERAQPPLDASSPDVSCMYTGQNLGGTPVENVDGGVQVLLSRDFDLSGESNVYVSYYRWFYTDDAAGADFYEFQVSDNGGGSWVTVENITARDNRWTPVAFALDPLITLNSTVSFRVRVNDSGVDSVCEGAIDQLEIVTLGCGVDPQEARLAAAAVEFDDSIDPACTDGDRIADAGETFDFIVTVENTGTTAATNTIATLVGIPAGLTLFSAAAVPVGMLADNGGSAVATWTLRVDDATPCQSMATLDVSVVADPPSIPALASFPLVLEEDIVPPISWYDDFDLGLPAWSIITYGGFNDWAPGLEDCAQNPGTPTTPALNFWYTGSTGVPTDCVVTPYGPLDDSAIRTPVIDTGFVRPVLLTLRWNQLLTLSNDGDAAEIWIDHDMDSVFDILARYRGQVTTNGDTLDVAVLDLQNNPMGFDLSNATQQVQIEFRFISDATGGGGVPLALGWIVDNVELEWNDVGARTCDANQCPACVSDVTVSAAAAAVCVNDMLLLDGSASSVMNCPLAGTTTLEWFRDGIPYSSGVDMINVQEPTAGTFLYRMQATCDTVTTCTDFDDFTLDVRTPPTAEAGPSHSVCAGDIVTLDASGSIDPGCPSGLLYEWRDSLGNVLRPFSPSPTWVPPTATAGNETYTVVVRCATDPGCPTEDTATVAVRAIPTADAGRSFDVCEGELVTLDASGSIDPGCPGGLLYEWRDSLGNILRPFAPGATWTPPTATAGNTTYTVAVRCMTDPGCETTGVTVVNVRVCTMAVHFDRFDAQRSRTGEVEISWSTLGEDGSILFDVERADRADGVYTSVGLTSARGSYSSYRVIDRGVSPVASPWYRIVEYTANGIGDRTRPFPVTSAHGRDAGRGRGPANGPATPRRSR